MRAKSRMHPMSSRPIRTAEAKRSCRERAAYGDRVARATVAVRRCGGGGGAASHLGLTEHARGLGDGGEVDETEAPRLPRAVLVDHPHLPFQ
jgi:hypothetical protein